MRLFPLVALACISLAGAVFAQQSAPGAPGEHGSDPHQLPSLPVGEADEHCVEVEIGNDKVYDCLNSKLRGEAKRVVPLPNIPPIGSSSSDLKLGIVNIPAVKQQYGKNYGKSAIPYRPSTK